MMEKLNHLSGDLDRDHLDISSGEQSRSNKRSKHQSPTNVEQRRHRPDESTPLINGNLSPNSVKLFVLSEVKLAT